MTHTRVDEIEALQGFDRVSLRRADEYPEQNHIVRVGPAVKRKITAGPDGLRLLAFGATPGEAYDPGGTL